MERILTANQMKSADKYTIEKLGVSSEILIERAGFAVANEIINRLKGGRVLVCIGKGNNGEDGKVIAEILQKTHGFNVSTLNVSNGIFKLFDRDYDIIVDCIFGIGLDREIEGKYKEAIERINNSGAYVVSCDIPSGINADTGKIMGVAVRANLTIAIQEYKFGHFLNDGIDYCGEVIAKDIGISIWGEDYAKRFNKEDLSKYFEPRKRNINKGNLGKVAIIGGSIDYIGSSLLSSNALTSMKMGNGYAYLFVPKSLLNIYAGKNPEVIVQGVLDDNGRIFFDENFLNPLDKFDCIAIGMGIGCSEEVYKIVKYLLSNYKGKLIIDADAINSISKFGVEVLENKTCQVILTPHIGEFARLLKTKTDVILSDIIGYSMDFAKKYNFVLLLKSATSFITDGTSVYINTSGNNGMAKAGSGDVLDGILAGIVSRSDDLLEATGISAYLFGLCGDQVKSEQNEYTMTASDIISVIPSVINSI